MKEILWIVSVFSILIFVGISDSHPGKGAMPEPCSEVPAMTIARPHFQYEVHGSLMDPGVHQKDVSPDGMIQSKSKDFRMVVTGEDDEDDHDYNYDDDGESNDNGNDDESSDDDGD